ncbi:hypothetical protein ACLKA6_005035 [Drosophila palustris]
MRIPRRSQQIPRRRQRNPTPPSRNPASPRKSHAAVKCSRAAVRKMPAPPSGGFPRCRQLDSHAAVNQKLPRRRLSKTPTLQSMLASLDVVPVRIRFYPTPPSNCIPRRPIEAVAYSSRSVVPSALA